VQIIMTSSVKPEVRNISQQAPPESDRATTVGNVNSKNCEDRTCTVVPNIGVCRMAGGFAAERPAGRRCRSIAAGALLQAPALSNKCERWRLVDSRRRRLDTDLLASCIALDVTDERIYFYNNNDNAVESVTFAGEGFTKVVTHGKIYRSLFTPTC